MKFIQSITKNQKYSGQFPIIAWVLIVLLLLGLALAVKRLGQTDQDGSLNKSVSGLGDVRDPREYKVFYKSGVFGPTNLRIHVGDIVHFQNDDFRAIGIKSDVESSTGGFASKKDILFGEEFVHTFSDAGIFSYHNTYNSDEGGFIIVRN